MQRLILNEFSVYLQQRPGELAGVLDAAKAAGVRVFSVSTTEYQDRGCVRLLGTPEAALRQMCESLVDAGIGPVVEAPVVVVGVEDKPAAIRDLSVMMADNRINIRYCYLIPGVQGIEPTIEGPVCVFRFDEHEKSIEQYRAHPYLIKDYPADFINDLLRYGGSLLYYDEFEPVDSSWQMSFPKPACASVPGKSTAA